MKRIILFLLILSVFTACQEDLLEPEPRNSISPEKFFNTEEDLILYTNSLISLPDGYSTYTGDQSSDNCATTGAVEIKTVLSGSPSSQNLTDGWSWGRLRSINFFLENYQKAQVNAATANHYAAIARYYRAEFYYNKVKRYSDVPWYDKVLSTTDKDLYKPQDARTLVVDKIMEDLDFAVKNLREQVPYGTVHKWAGLMLQARIALHEGTFRKYHPELNLQNTANRFLQIARDAAKQLMDSGKFALYNTGKPDEDYGSLFVSASLAGNKEVILNNVNDFDKGKKAGHRYEIQDYEQSPSKALVTTYLMKDGSRYTDKPGYQTFQFVEEMKDRDPRLAQTIAAPGWIKADNPSKPYIQRLNKNFTGYHQIKGYVNTTSQSIEQGVDIPVYRYAEALLIFAEAKAELNELTQADLDLSINLLRDRAGMPRLELATANVNPDPVLGNQYPSVSGTNKGVILEIRRERRVELALEGYRFDDLMRWSAGKLLEVNPVGIYFPGLGKFDLTGDKIPDIFLIGKDETIPAGANREKNELGEVLVYYKAGTIDDDVTVFLQNGTMGGSIVTEKVTRKFTEPRDYYRPIPFNEILLNPNLKQPFGWN